MASRMHEEPPLHELVHKKLNLERDFAIRGQTLEAEMRAANAELARAIGLAQSAGAGAVALGHLGE